MTAAQVVLALAVALNLYLSALTLARTRLISSQMAVLTIRVTALAETIDALDTDLRKVVADSE